MKITAASISNFKRIKDVRIAPDADRTILLIGGKNAQGKSSILDALTAAIGGKRAQPTDPVRHGARDEKLARIERLVHELEQLKVDVDGYDITIGKQNAEATTARTALAAADERWIAGKAERDRIAADLARAGEHNRAIFAAEAQMKRRAEADTTVTQLTAERDSLTKVIETIDERKAAILRDAKLPVEGLNVTDEGIELAGVPFAQASAAERHRVALALAIAASPGLDDVWIRDGALLDEESLELVATHARAAGKRVWIERVGTSDPGVIVIQDGKVVDPRPITSAPTAEVRP